MAGQSCAAEIYGCVTRFTRLSSTGATPAGADGIIVTDQLVELVIGNEVEAGAEVSQVSACGSYAWTPYKGPDNVKWKTLQLTMARPDYELEEMLTDASLIVAAGATVGIADPPLGLRPTSSGVSIEIWSMRLVDGFQAATNPWKRSVAFRTYNWSKGPRRWFNGANVPTFTGIGTTNPNWGNGPTNDWTGPTDRPVAEMDTSVAPPTPVCGFQAIPTQV